MGIGNDEAEVFRDQARPGPAASKGDGLPTPTNKSELLGGGEVGIARRVPICTELGIMHLLGQASMEGASLGSCLHLAKEGINMFSARECHWGGIGDAGDLPQTTIEA